MFCCCRGSVLFAVVIEREIESSVLGSAAAVAAAALKAGGGKCGVGL